MTQRTVSVGSSVGLHARPAALFVKAAAATGHDVSVTLADKTVDARSLLAVMSLGAGSGSELVLDVAGADEERVADELAAMLESDLDAA